MNILHNRIKYRLIKRGHISHKPQTEGMFESSAIGDLAFLLLIYFIVTASFLLRQGIFFSLPSKTAGSVRVDEKQVIDVYPENTGFRFDDRLLSRSDFKKVVADHKEKDLKSILMIHMKPDVVYDRLVDCLSIARETGLERVSLKNPDIQ
ncbi:MAG: biopolymer transporter ExbD [bacterium]